MQAPYDTVAQNQIKWNKKYCCCNEKRPCIVTSVKQRFKKVLVLIIIISFLKSSILRKHFKTNCFALSITIKGCFQKVKSVFKEKKKHTCSSRFFGKTTFQKNYINWRNELILEKCHWTKNVLQLMDEWNDRRSFKVMYNKFDVQQQTCMLKNPCRTLSSPAVNCKIFKSLSKKSNFHNWNLSGFIINDWCSCHFITRQVESLFWAYLKEDLFYFPQIIFWNFNMLCRITTSKVNNLFQKLWINPSWVSNL